MIVAVSAARWRSEAQMASTAPSARAASRAWRRPEVGQRRVGLALPAAVGVPLGLAVADEQDAGGR